MGIDALLTTARKLAIVLAVLGALVAGWIALHFIAYNFFANAGSWIPEFMLTPLRFVSYYFPSNFWNCVYIFATVYAARWLWDTQREYLRMFASAN